MKRYKFCINRFVNGLMTCDKIGVISAKSADDAFIYLRSIYPFTAIGVQAL